MYKDFRPWTEEDKKEAAKEEKYLRATGCPEDLIEEIVDSFIFNLYEEQFEEDNDEDYEDDEEFSNSSENNDNNSSNTNKIKTEIDYEHLPKVDYSFYYDLREGRNLLEAKAALRYYRRQDTEKRAKMTFEEELQYDMEIEKECLEFAKELGMNIYSVENKKDKK